jgi:hypothetical protein
MVTEETFTAMMGPPSFSPRDIPKLFFKRDLYRYIPARTSRNQKRPGFSGKLQITNPKLQTWGVLRTDLNAFGVEFVNFFLSPIGLFVISDIVICL